MAGDQKAEKPAEKVAVERITLLYRCPECNATAQQPLPEIVEVGTAVCTECDCDMELEGHALVAST